MFNQNTNDPISDCKQHHQSSFRSSNPSSNNKKAFEMNELILIINNVDRRHIQNYMFILIFPSNHGKPEWQQSKKTNHLDIIMMRERIFNQRQTFDLAIYTKITGFFSHHVKSNVRRWKSFIVFGRFKFSNNRTVRCM